MQENINVSELDFSSIKRNLIEHFKSDSGSFTDWDFEGSNLNQIVDLLAYNTHYNAVAAHMAVNESFIDSAQLRSSVVSAAKLLGYIPKSYSAARLNLEGKFLAKVVPGNPSHYSIPKGCAVSVDYGSKVYNFTVLDDIINLTRESDQGVEYYKIDEDTPFVAYEGHLRTKSYKANAADTDHRYLIPDENIDLSTLKVKVYPNSSKSDGSEQAFKQFDSNLRSSGTSNLFFLNENHEGLYEITFGNNAFGAALEPGNIVEIQYLSTSGSEGNRINSNTFTFINPVDASSPIASVYSLNYINGARTSGGADRESVAKLKRNVTNNFITQNRAVTADDYKSLILSKFQNVQSVSVWGGEDNNPPIYGKVFIAPKPTTEYIDDQAESDVLNASDKTAILDFLSDKKVLAIIPEIVDPRYIDIALDVLFKYDQNQTNLSATEMQVMMREDVLKAYNNESLNTFDTVFRHSSFLKAVDNSHSSILSSMVRVYVQKNISIPTKSRTEDGRLVTNFTLDFGVPLKPDDGSTIIQLSSDVKWYENGEVITLEDEASKSDLNIRDVYIYAFRSGIKTKGRKCGTIQLSTGVMQLNNVYADNAIVVKFTMNPVSLDIVGKRDVLLRITEEDTIVKAYKDEIAAGGQSRALDWLAFPKER